MQSKIFEKKFDFFTFEVWDDRPTFQFKEVHQIHSDIIVSFNEASNEIKADGIYFTKNELKQMPIAIKTADCMPIILWNKNEAVFIHAGWKGLSTGILKNFNFIPTNAFIGPSICKDSFEVTEEFQENFPESKLISRNGKLYFDLSSEASSQLIKNYKNINVLDSTICTLKNLEYNSYRRNKTHIRNFNIIMFKG